MTTKGPFMVESFIIVGSFDCDCTHIQIGKTCQQRYVTHEHT
jgi:hypothetical protein